MKKYVTILLCSLFFANTYANNITVTNVSVTGSDITFTLSWDNSWNTTNNIDPLYPNNWDAAWIFIKYQNAIDNLWKHAKVSNLNADHTVTGAGGVLQVDAVTDSMGVFIRRSSAGFGNNSNATVTLKMGNLVGSGAFNFKVFGIEMVHVPTSNFWLGDGTAASATQFLNVEITSSLQSKGFAANVLYPSCPAVPNTFPMAYNGYYCMKYEASIEQWIDFLNTLTYDQQAERVDITPNAAINTQAYTNNVSTFSDNIIRVATSGLNNTLPAIFGADASGNSVYNEAADALNMAFALGNKADILAYLDWSGLRPLTEFEFEKACRGTRPALLNENAWGSITTDWVTRAQLTNLGTASETYSTITNGRVMAFGGAISTGGPARCGVFATSSTGRESSGAGFYGNMELSGNCQETVVYVDAGGVGYTATNGDGTLTTLGDANVPTWPDPTLTPGMGGRGGEYYQGTSYQLYLRTSYRRGAIGAARSFLFGIRGVRSM
jgi:formylglycine-generating enzyme required for sulfatase activity